MSVIRVTRGRSGAFEYEELGRKKAEAKEDIAKTIIKHHTSGYDLDSQVTYYAVTHFPKIKKETNRVTGELKDRLEHDHIYIALYDKVGDVQLRNTFANTYYMDSVLQSYIKFCITHILTDNG